MSSRYAEEGRRIAGDLELHTGGLGIVVAPATEQALVAKAVVAAWPGAQLGVLGAEVLERPGARLVVTLPAVQAEARDALTMLNGMRNRLAMAGCTIVLVIERGEITAVQQYAGDSYSTVLFTTVVQFVPDRSVSYSEARRKLGEWLRQRIGQLDLRGFIRAETEDVAWKVEDVYQEVRGVPWYGRTGADDASREPMLFFLGTKPLVDVVHASLTATDSEPAPSHPRVVILGHPGSGKTFFLRWLALHAVAVDTLFGIYEPWPVLLSLAAYARAPRSLSLYDYVTESLLAEHQPAAHVLADAVARKQVLFLLDGLDEAGDEAGRRHVGRAVQELGEQASGCPIVTTSRVSGYSDAPLAGRHVEVAPLEAPDIERFLVTWCRLYAIALHGIPAAKRGEQEGKTLARDVLTSRELMALAQNPLLLTVLAIVHRAGVRLPDHRVELYSHATQVLVERWNQVRSLAGTGNPSPIKSADAVRLLGPVALDMVRWGVRGAVSEDALIRSLERSLAAGHLRSLTTAEEALRLFQGSLGLLVEQGPGLYAFLHLTLAEYFAARELVRLGELEALTEDPEEAFQPEWRETILLAAGELGVIRADDTRLEQLVTRLITASNKRRSRPSPTVPSLLAGLLADDPGLSQQSAKDLIEHVIPTWWFERRYKRTSWSSVIEEARSLIARIARGRFSSLLQEQMKRHFEHGASANSLAIWHRIVPSTRVPLSVETQESFRLAFRKLTPP